MFFCLFHFRTVCAMVGDAMKSITTLLDGGGVGDTGDTGESLFSLVILLD